MSNRSRAHLPGFVPMLSDVLRTDWNERDVPRSGFGRAVSRILSTPLRAERIICLSSHTRDPVGYPTAKRAASRSPIWPCTRWGFPCRVTCVSRGGLLPHLFTLTQPLPARRYLLCGTVRRAVFQPFSRVYLRQNRSYAASRSVVFGLSSPGLRQKRSSALPKPPQSSPPTRPAQ
jgi:hypothetical protein